MGNRTTQNRSLLLWLFSLLALALSACGGCEEGEDIQDTASGKILVSPSPIAFAQVPTGSESTIDVVIANTDIDPLTVYEITLAPRGADGSTTGLSIEVPDLPFVLEGGCLLYTSPSPRDKRQSRMPSSA